jgi:hypothetical protein
VLEIEEQLRRYGEAVERWLVQDVGVAGGDRNDVAPERSRGGHRRLFLTLASGLAAAAVVAISVAAVTVLRSDPDDDAIVATDTSPGGVFDARTDTVLVFSDGIDGITALDLDAGVASRRILAGERAGDQPYRTGLVGDHLVVGWGEIYAAPLDGGPSARIDTATVFIPAAEPGQVWTVDYPGGRIGQGRAEIRRVTMDGRVVFSTDVLDTDRYYPLYGVPGGLVVRGPEGLAIWDAANGRVGDPIGPAAPANHFVSDGTHLAWCDETCQEPPQVVDLGQPGPPTAPAGVANQRLALSPDGGHLAVIRPTTNGRAELLLTDLATGEQTRVATVGRQWATLQWADDSHQLFYATTAQSSTTTLGRYDLTTGAWQAVEVDLGNTVSFVPIARDRATALLAGRRLEPNDCPPAGNEFPSGRTESCTFPIHTRTVGSDRTG